MKQQPRLPLVLIIFDGWGIAPPGPGNAITQAKTPTMESLMERFPSTTLAASGTDVGLPQNQEGNSEAGHMNIGAGRIVEQDARRILKSINDGSFFKNAAFIAAFHHVEKYRSQLHLMGLLTDEQSGHACPDHLLALIAMARSRRLRSVFLHLFTDGRDAPPQAGIHLLRRLELMTKGRERIATVMGRFYAMDRKKMWPRTKRAYDAMVLGKGRQAATAEHAILEAYERGQTDEFIEPTIVGARNRGRIRDDDSVIFFNLRSDRARQLSKAFVQEKFNSLNPGSFRRQHLPKNLRFVAMTDFGPDLGDIYTAFPSVDLYSTLPVMLRGLRQLYIAESEKYAHVTYFFNGGYDKPVAGEDRVLIPSPNVPSYDAAPGMRANEIADYVVKDLKRHRHDVIVANFANPDMLGHTGNIRAMIKGVEVVDACVGRIHQAVAAAKGTLVVTADHGNAESKLAKDGKSVNTEHTRSRVPFIIATPRPLSVALRNDGRLADVSPTILELLGIQQPSTMTGRSLMEDHHAA